MIKVSLYSSTGIKTRDLTVSPKKQYSSLNPELIAQALYVEQDQVSSKPGHAKTRAEVSGGGRKPHRQKGTGRARAGSIRSPLWRGGGVTFGPRKDNKTHLIPEKMRKTALYSLWVDKIKKHRLGVLESVRVESNKTKNADSLARKISPEEMIILAVEKEQAAQALPWRNLAQVELIAPAQVTLRMLNSKRYLLLSKDVFADLKTRLEK